MTKVFEFGEDTWSLGIHSTLPTCCGQIQGSRRAPDMKQKENSNMAVGSQVQSSLKKEWPFAVSAPATEEVGMGMASGWGDVVGDAGENDCKGAVGTKGWLKRAPPKKETIAWVKNERGAHRTRLGAWRKLWCDRNVPCFDICGGKSQELKKGKSQRS